ncbi:MAG TPA: alpha/beta fold hydrolase [Ramlibacter sp.]|jgi:predicted alpha/beta hydrolase family esterase|uniref:RBBP9/YdeN family alpha/beta hydrolase n=1 Tax=Ramlibacter sp. TaxID=1917967 RepID=UPI002D5982D9|nr:alpha/beta fold hydrolase [Ramlibacter sp.]HZY17397.1 alpha/beta fold hydrolase [Ramlibacter sp.]
MKPSNVLVLPGWQNSGPTHWQTLWEQRHGYRRVEQHDWMRPLRGDWIARLEDVVLGCDEPPVLVAHSLGCILVAAWAGVSRNAQRVKAALLVAPGDVERVEIREQLPSWVPIPLAPLPFRSVLLASRNDPYCSFERARGFAQAWGSQCIDHGDSGHINADAGLGSWPEGHVLLQDLMT